METLYSKLSPEVFFALESSMHLLTMQQCMLHQVTNEQELPELQLSHGPAPVESEHVEVFCKPLRLNVSERCKPVYEHAITAETLGRRNIRGDQLLGAFIGLPIFGLNGFFGVLSFSSSTYRSKPFTQSEKVYLGHLAKWVSTHIEDVQIKQGDLRHFDTLQIVLPTLPDAVLELDSSGAILSSLVPGHCRYIMPTGNGKSEAILLPEVRELCDLLLTAILSGGPSPRMQIVIPDVEETTTHIEAVGELLHPTGTVAISIEDITQHKEQELIARQQREIADILQTTILTLRESEGFEQALTRILMQMEHMLPFKWVDIVYVRNGRACVEKTIGYDNPEMIQKVMDLKLNIEQVPTLSYMYFTRQPVVVMDVSTDLHWVNSETITWIKSFAGIPILHDDKLVGFVYLTSDKPNTFRLSDVPTLQTLMKQISLLHQHMDSYEQIQQLAAIEERQRLARDLHDEVKQTLYSASLMSGALPILMDQKPEMAKRELVELHRFIRGALAEMRTLLLELRPKAIADANLKDILGQLVDAVSVRTSANIKINIKGSRILPPEVTIALYRITQEALNNVVKYAAAEQVVIYLNFEKGSVLLQIVDDGVGFDRDDVLPDHMGLRIIHERASNIGAQLDIDTEPGKGTRIMVVWKDEDYE